MLTYQGADLISGGEWSGVPVGNSAVRAYQQSLRWTGDL